MSQAASEDCRSFYRLEYRSRSCLILVVMRLADTPSGRTLGTFCPSRHLAHLAGLPAMSSIGGSLSCDARTCRSPSTCSCASWLSCLSVSSAAPAGVTIGWVYSVAVALPARHEFVLLIVWREHVIQVRRITTGWSRTRRSAGLLRVTLHSYPFGLSRRVAHPER